MSDTADEKLHAVVVNGAEQYSIWPARRQPPEGWWAVGDPASRDHCLGVISRNWTDMRPIELRGGTTAQAAATEDTEAVR